MPIYEYTCSDCGQQFEQMTTMSKADETPCANCGSEQTQRQLSIFGVGSGGSQPQMPACPGGQCAMNAASPCANGMCGGPMMG